MCKVQMLRALVEQRLALAAEEIFGLFERTMADYEEKLCRSKEENERQRELLDAVFNPQLRLHRADVQQLLVSKEEVTPEQQEWSSSLDQEDPEPPHFRDDEEELWTSQEEEQLQGLQEDDITKFLFTHVPVKSEIDKEKHQFSQLHQRQTEQMEREADGEDCGGPEPARNSDPYTHLQTDSVDKTGDSFEPETVSDDDWKETGESQSGLNFLKKDEVPVRCSTGEKECICSECGKIFGTKTHLKIHMRSHTGEKPFSCSVCQKTFTESGSLHTHMRIHTGEKPYSCSVCKKSFTQNGTLKTHMRLHTGEKPFSCSVCGKGFIVSGHLKRHMANHTGEKRFSCPFCDKRFPRKDHLDQHMSVHTGEKRFSCSVCDQRFTWHNQLKNHQCVGHQSSQLHQTQTEENREAEPPASSSAEQMETEADGEGSGGLWEYVLVQDGFT